MPLYTYACDNEKCDAVAVEMLIMPPHRPPKWVRCVQCGHSMTRRFGVIQLRYGRNMHAKPIGKDQFVTGLGRHVSDPFEYAKAMDKAGLRRTSGKELEEIQRDTRVNVAGEKKQAQKKAKVKALEMMRSWK